MAKSHGMGMSFFGHGVDISSDIQSLGRVGGGPALLDFTDITKSARARSGGIYSGEMTFSAFLDTALAHVSLSTLLTTDRIYSLVFGSALGDDVASIIAKQVNYDPNRGNDGSIMFNAQLLSNAFPLEFGDMLTAGKKTDTAATNGTAVDYGTQATAVTITSSSVANPTVITTATPHGLVTGDSVVIAGHSGSSPSINAEYTVTVTGASTFTIPVNVTTGGTGGTMTKTSTNFGASAYLHVFSFTGTSITVKVQDSADNSTFADLLTFTAATAAGAERIQSSSATGIVRRYVRAISTGTFNPCTFSVAFTRHLAASIQ